MVKNPLSILVLGCFCIFIAGCSKKETIEVDNETQSIVDCAIADQEFMGILPAVFQSALQTKGIGNPGTSTITPCNVLTFVSGDTINFSSNPVYSLSISNNSCSLLMPDGKARSGKISVMFTGKIKTLGSRIICKLSDYSTEGTGYFCDSITATIKESNQTYTSFEVKLANGSCKSSFYTIKFESSRTVTIYPTGDSNGSAPAVYSYGEASGLNRFGKKFTANVLKQTPLIKHDNCKYIDKGLLELVPEGFKMRLIDFGNGKCDDMATFTVNDNTVAFKLK